MPSSKKHVCHYFYMIKMINIDLVVEYKFKVNNYDNKISTILRIISYFTTWDAVANEPVLCSKYESYLDLCSSFSTGDAVINEPGFKW